MPLAVALDAANEHDLSLLGPTLDEIDRLPLERPTPTPRKPQGLCLDNAYACPIVRELCALARFVAHIRPRGEEIVRKRRGHKPRRWVVERAHSWLNRFRRLLVRWEKKELNHLGLIHFACGLIAYQQAGLFG